jgi:hypothetical protein
MNKLPEHIEVQLNGLIDAGKSVDEIAFMMRLSRETVESAIEARRVNTTKEEPAKKTG